jgi:hypothetical protein
LPEVVADALPEVVADGEPGAVGVATWAPIPEETAVAVTFCYNCLGQQNDRF